jgi:hypothetical protein
MFSTALGQTKGDGNDGSSRSQLLEPKRACQLNKQDRIPSRVVYAIPGTYTYDGHHGSILEIRECDEVVLPIMSDEAAARIAEYHAALHERCGGYWMGDHISGVFTGRFVRRKAHISGTPTQVMMEYFVIDKIDTKELDPALIACPKVH